MQLNKLQINNEKSLYSCSSGATGSLGARGLRKQFGANRDRDLPHETDHVTNSPGQFHGDNAVKGPVPIQQQKHRPRKLTVSVHQSYCELCWCIV